MLFLWAAIRHPRMSRGSAEKIQEVLSQEREEEREKERSKAGTSSGGGRGRGQWLKGSHSSQRWGRADYKDQVRKQGGTLKRKKGQ